MALASFLVSLYCLRLKIRLPHPIPQNSAVLNLGELVLQIKNLSLEMMSKE